MKNATLEKIYKAGLNLLVPLSLEATYVIILQEAMKLVKADSGVIHLREGGDFIVGYATLKRFYTIKPRREGNVYKAFIARQPIIADYSDFGPAHSELHHLGIKSAIFIPLSNRNQAIGVLSLNSKTKEYFSKSELAVLKLFGSLANLAIRKSQLYDEIKKALEARDLFISMAAHELRTPLTTISGYSQLLYSKLSGADTPESRWISNLSWETSRLTNLVNELLEVDRIQKGQFRYTFKECSLGEIIKRALADFRFTHPKHDVIFKNRIAEGKDAIIGDFDKLLQMVINILDNAAKFSLPKAGIAIGLRTNARRIYLEIKDHGKGIIRKDLPSMFEKFHRGSDHSKEGLGLGLFLAKNIVAQHHGRISIKSNTKKGTIVEVNLPKIKYG